MLQFSVFALKYFHVHSRGIISTNPLSVVRYLYGRYCLVLSIRWPRINFSFQMQVNYFLNGLLNIQFGGRAQLILCRVFPRILGSYTQRNTEYIIAHCLSINNITRIVINYNQQVFVKMYVGIID